MNSTSVPPPARRDDPRMHTVEMAAVRLADHPAAETLGSGAVRPPLTTRQVALLVALGGGIGAILRLLMTGALPTVTTPTLVEVPWATLWANILGCLGLGSLVGVLEVRPGRPWMQPLLGTGLCGGFTTMASVVLEGSAMIGADFPLPAFSYAMTTVVVCIAAVLGGFLLGRRLARRQAVPEAGQAQETPATTEPSDGAGTADGTDTTGTADGTDTTGTADGTDTTETADGTDTTEGTEASETAEETEDR